VGLAAAGRADGDLVRATARLTLPARQRSWRPGRARRSYGRWTPGICQICARHIEEDPDRAASTVARRDHVDGRKGAIRGGSRISPDYPNVLGYARHMVDRSGGSDSDTAAGLSWNQADRRAYIRIAALLRERITTGELAGGQATPSITRLCADHGVARQTAAHALRVLQDANLGCTHLPG
jgi:Bacterial regulatory proteins, gntR family